MRMIVTIGWLIYPIGYSLAYLVADGTFATNSYGEAVIVNCVYNLADLINKGGFGLCIWAAAHSDN